MNATPQIVGLFEGYGGLTMGVQAALGGDLIAYAEVEPAACRVLAHHHPDVPNLGDVAAVDWSQVRRDAARQLVLAGGFPCTDVSSAGRRLGLRPGTRSGLWTQMSYAVDQLRPDLVVIENVRGLTSADAACEVEPCPWCLGDGEGRPLRALGAVLGDLANLGYDASWHGLRAADVGAPHGRYRIFIVARPAADAGGGELQRRGVGGVLAGPEATRAGEGPQRERDRHAAGDGGEDVADAERVRRGAGRPAGSAETPGGRPRRHAAGRGIDAAADPENDGRAPLESSGHGPAGAGFAGDHTSPAAPGRDGREGRQERDLGPEAGQPAPCGGDAARRVLDWGDYEPAIRRWEQLVGRVAPAPTMTGVRGGRQLAPAFVEWMMGLPAGHVTDVPGVSRNEQLKMLGNGVVPQQAAAALAYLLAADGAAA